jgi:hypothetical protein
MSTGFAGIAAKAVWPICTVLASHGHVARMQVADHNCRWRAQVNTPCTAARTAHCSSSARAYLGIGAEREGVAVRLLQCQQGCPATWCCRCCRRCCAALVQQAECWAAVAALVLLLCIRCAQQA